MSSCDIQGGVPACCCAHAGRDARRANEKPAAHFPQAGFGRSNSVSTKHHHSLDQSSWLRFSFPQAGDNSCTEPSRSEKLTGRFLPVSPHPKAIDAMEPMHQKTICFRARRLRERLSPEAFNRSWERIAKTRLDMSRDEHNKAAEHHENAARAHRAAAEHHGRGDHAKAKEHSASAKQQSQAANQYSDQAHSKSQQQK
jgi:hypothetical protein